MKKQKILKLSPDFRYLQKLALKIEERLNIHVMKQERVTSNEYQWRLCVDAPLISANAQKPFKIATKESNPLIQRRNK